MAERMSDTRLTEIEKRHDAATEGPWQADGSEITAADEWIGETCDIDDGDKTGANAEFIAHSWVDVKDLLADNKRLRARVGELTALLNDPDRLAEELRELRAILSETALADEADRLADGGDV